MNLKDSYSALCIEDTASSSASNDAIVHSKVFFGGYMKKSFLHLANTLNNTIENIVGHPIKFLLKRMQHSALKPHFFFLHLASGKGLCRSSLKTL